jgi:hypothetical protein
MMVAYRIVLQLKSSRSTELETEVEQQHRGFHDGSPPSQVRMIQRAESVTSETGSVFSDQTLASSETNYSVVGRYTSTQIATATDTLLRTLCAHSSLVTLYCIAIILPGIGAERLQRNVRRMLKSFARNLREEASGELERLAAQLVTVKAGFVAQRIVERFEVHTERQSQKREDSSDEEEGDPIDEDTIQDLAAFEEFLLESNAFVAFQQQMFLFVHQELPVSFIATVEEDRVTNETLLTSPGRSEIIAVEPESNETGFKSRTLARIESVFQRVLIAAGCMEPSLEPGKVRLRWSCVSTVHQINVANGSVVYRNVVSDSGAMSLSFATMGSMKLLDV